MAKVDTVFGNERKFGFFKAASTIAFCITIIFLFATTESFAKDYSFTWSANPEPVEGYKLYYKKGGEPLAPFNGTGAIQGPSPISIGKQTTFTITGLDDNATYYFALTAYDGSEESGYSDIVAVNVTSATPPSAGMLMILLGAFREKAMHDDFGQTWRGAAGALRFGSSGGEDQGFGV